MSTEKHDMLRIQPAKGKVYLRITPEGKFRGRLVNYIFGGAFTFGLVGAIVGSLLGRTF